MNWRFIGWFKFRWENWLFNVLIEADKNKFRKNICIIFNWFSRNVRILCCFIWLQHFNVSTSFRISTFSTNEKLKLDLEVQFSLMAIILGWALYFTIVLMAGSLIFSDVRSIWLNCVMLGLVMTLEKKSFKTLAVSLLLLVILSSSKSLFFSFEILFDNNGLTTVQNFLLPQTFFWFKLLKYSLTFSQKCYTQISLFSVSIFIFLSPILEKNVPQLCS